jgi:haloalkane dehalogenase
VVDLMKKYSKWLQHCPQPKLMFYAIPGFITTMATVQWAKEYLPNIKMVEMHNELHFAQETMPEIFSAALREWYISEVQKK